jgi:putative endonuclease
MNNRKFYVYILSSFSKVIYIGITNSLERRLYEHRKGLFEGFTKKYHCHRLMHFEEFDSPIEAISREKELKGWRREKKVHLIETKNPNWDDLAKTWALDGPPKAGPFPNNPRHPDAERVCERSGGTLVNSSIR